MTDFISRAKRGYPYKLLGGGLILVAWQLLSMKYPAVMFPSPASTWDALRALVASAELQTNLVISFQRQVTGLGLGVALGILTGVLSGLGRALEYTLQPLVNSLMTIPAIVFVVMAMVWFGMGSLMVVFLIALLVYPVMHINTVEGFKSIDKSLLEMARVYEVPGFVKVTKIYLPGLVRSLVAGFSLATASSVRLTVMAELLGAREGIGQRIAISRAYLETEKLFAWVLVLVVIVVSLDWLLIRPVNAFAARWQGNDGHKSA